MGEISLENLLEDLKGKEQVQVDSRECSEIFVQPERVSNHPQATFDLEVSEFFTLESVMRNISTEQITPNENELNLILGGKPEVLVTQNHIHLIPLIEKIGGRQQLKPTAKELEYTSEKSNSKILTLKTLMEKIEGKANPIDKAKEVISKKSVSKSINQFSRRIISQLGLMVIKGNIYYYDGPVWKVLNDSVDLATILKSDPGDLAHELETLGDSEYNKVMKSILSEPDINKNIKFNQDNNLICLRNSAYNINDKTIIEVTPRMYFSTNLDITREDVERQDNYGYFANYLDTLSGGDKRVETLVLEVMGVLFSNYMPKHVYILTGKSNSGKSVFAEFISKLIGEANIVSVPDIDEIADDKWLSGSINGKKLLMSLDLPDFAISTKAIARIKQLTGDSEYLRANQKYKDSVQIQNTAKVLFATNHPFRVKGKADDEGMRNRMVVIPFLNAIPPEKQDHNLVEKLMLEKGYILKRCMKALQNWVENNHIFSFREDFLHYATDENMNFSDNYSFEEQLSTAINEFIEEDCLIKEGSWCSTDDLHRAYQKYCESMGIKPADKASFGRILAKNKKLDRGKKKDIRGFRGIEICNEKIGIGSE